jgi:hypothetical protein
MELAIPQYYTYGSRAAATDGTYLRNADQRAAGASG